MSISTAITSSSSSYCNQLSKQKNLSIVGINKTSKDTIQPPFYFLKFRAKHGFSKCISMSSKAQTWRTSASPPTSDSSNSPWKKWGLGILVTVILPAVGHKGGLWVSLKGKIDNAIQTVEHVTEVVEEIAEEAEKILEEVEMKLPNDSKLRKSLESFDDLAKSAVKEARKAEDLVHKVKDIEKEIEVTMIKAGTGQLKNKEAKS